MMLWLHVLFVSLLVGTRGFHAWLSLRNLGYAGRRLAEERTWLEDTLGIENPERLLGYERATTGISLLRSWLTLLLVLVALYTGLLADVTAWLEATGWPLVLRGTAFFLVLTVVNWVLSKPIELFDAFVVQALFGLHRGTPRAWLRTAVANLAVTGGVSVAFAATLLATIGVFGDAWWLATLVLYAAYTLSMQVVYPLVVAPRFADYEPLPDGDTRDAVESVFDRAGISCTEVLVVGASQHTARSNAYLLGFGSSRRVVLYDTLLDRLDDRELQAVLAHELGHLRHRHVWKRLATDVARAGVALFGVHLLLSTGALYAQFGIGMDAVYAGVIVAGLWIYPAAHFTAPLTNRLSIRQEYEADAFAVDVMDGGDALASALASLLAGNLSNPFPHPLYRAFNRSHPSIPERIRHVRARAPAQATPRDD